MEARLAIEHYEDAKAILVKYNTCKKEFIKAVVDIALADANFSSVTAKITKELDTDAKVSKTALKALVEGHEEVVAAKDNLKKKKAKKEIAKVKMEYLEHCYSLEKKMMDSLTADKKYLGG